MTKATCANHPQTTTLLSCAACDTPICVDCVRHTQVGTRCLHCAGESVSQQRPEPQPPALIPIGDGFAFVAVAVLLTGLISPPLVAFLGLTYVNFAMMNPLVSAAASTKTFRIGSLLYLLFMLMFAGLITLAGASEDAKKLADLNVTPMMAATAAAGALLTSGWLIAGARALIKPLRESGFGALAGAIAGSAIVAVLTCVSLSGLLMLADM